MNSNEYEEYVTKLIRSLDCFKSAKIYQNRRFPGVRQPGNYEIDVAVELSLESIIHFLLIIECKNWKRPVDRPVIQKLIQTRDTLAAQKAAVASPIGFSQEAIDVAKSNGVALWIIAENRWDHICGVAPPPHIQRIYKAQYIYKNLRRNLLNELNIVPPKLPEVIFVDITRFEPINVKNIESLTFRELTSGVDEITAFWGIANSILEDSKQKNAFVLIENWCKETKKNLYKYGLNKEQVNLSLSAIICGDRGTCVDIIKSVLEEIDRKEIIRFKIFEMLVILIICVVTIFVFSLL